MGVTLMLKGGKQKPKIGKAMQQIALYLFAAIMLVNVFSIRATYAEDYNFTNPNNIATSSGTQYVDGVQDDDYTYHERGASTQPRNDGHDCPNIITYEDGTPQEHNGTAYLWKNEWLHNDRICYFNFDGANSSARVYQIVCRKYGITNPGTNFCPDGYSVARDEARKKGHVETISIGTAFQGALRVNYFYINDGKKLISADGEERFAVDGDRRDLFFREGEAKCPDRIDLNNRAIADDSDQDGILLRRHEGDSGCVPDEKKAVYLGSEQNIPANLKEESAKFDAPKTDSDDCQNTGVFGWIVCPLVHIFGTVIDGVHDQAITPLLKIEPLRAVDNAACASDQKCSANAVVYNVWKAFRNLANILFIIVFFVIIFSQALGSGLDAYSIRRMLPRLVIAAIAVQLSFFVAGFILDLGNVLGAGVKNLIELPFNDVFTSGGEQPIASQLLSTLTTTAAVGVAAAAALFSIVPILTAAVTAILLVVIVLALRALLIYSLIIAAPIAFALWVLPNTESIFKSWWTFFFRAVMMYPIIEGLFALSKVFSKLAGKL